jgi:hypothetical protein
MLFILVMDVLISLFAKASEHGLQQPIGHLAIKYQCSMYADDVILFVSPIVPEAQVVGRILDIFGNATGLRTNISKCSITPIYGAKDMLQQIQDVLPCQMCQFPITYLGVPLSTTTIPKSHIRPLIDRVATRLPAWQGPLMPKSASLLRPSSASRHCRGTQCCGLHAGGDHVAHTLDVVATNGPRQSLAALPMHVELEVRQLFEASIAIQVGNGAQTFFSTVCWLDGEAERTQRRC